MSTLKERALDRAKHVLPDGLAGFDEQIISDMVDRYLERVPKKFQDASLEMLYPDQHLPELASWLTNPKSLTLFIAGEPGNGKTYAAHALMATAFLKWLMDLLKSDVQPSPGPVISVPEMLDSLRGNNDEVDHNYWSMLKTTPLLGLDDLSAVRVTPWAIERMWLLADARTSAELRTIITTNSTWDALVSTWGEPVLDRFKESSRVIKFDGPSRRIPID